jgi:hypothetical protein
MRPSRIRYLTPVILLSLLIISKASATPEVPPSPTLDHVQDEAWDYVILGCSIGTWWYSYYQAHMESDLGITLAIHNYYVSGQPLADLYKNLLNNESLRDDIRKAEVITIGIGFFDMYFSPFFHKYINGLSDDNQLEQKIKVFRETYDLMLDEVVKLASTSHTLIRIMDLYFPDVRRHREMGIYSISKKYWMKFNECIHESGLLHGIPVAHIFEAFNGLDGEDDPILKGYISGDRLHPSRQGLELIAEEFLRLGYKYSTQ